jgi:hypothetical protein
MSAVRSTMGPSLANTGRYKKGAGAMNSNCRLGIQTRFEAQLRGQNIPIILRMILAIAGENTKRIMRTMTFRFITQPYWSSIAFTSEFLNKDNRRDKCLSCCVIPKFNDYGKIFDLKRFPTLPKLTFDSGRILSKISESQPLAAPAEGKLRLTTRGTL